VCSVIRVHMMVCTEQQNVVRTAAQTKRGPRARLPARLLLGSEASPRVGTVSVTRCGCRRVVLVSCESSDLLRSSLFGSERVGRSYSTRMGHGHGAAHGATSNNIPRRPHSSNLANNKLIHHITPKSTTKNRTLSHRERPDDPHPVWGLRPARAGRDSQL
jgi:hypothetical protein